MNWNNINLNDGYEREQNIIDPYTSACLLLEISCNLPDINKETVRKQFNESLERSIESAREIFEANINNYVKQARKERGRKRGGYRKLSDRAEYTRI